MDTCKTVHTHIYIYVYVRMYIYIYVYVYIYVYNDGHRRRLYPSTSSSSSSSPVIAYSFRERSSSISFTDQPFPPKKKQNSLYPLRPTSRKLSSPLISSHPLSLSLSRFSWNTHHSYSRRICFTHSLSLSSLFFHRSLVNAQTIIITRVVNQT